MVRTAEGATRRAALRQTACCCGCWELPSDASCAGCARCLPQMAVALGGRIAEELIFGENDITTGASNDFQQVTRTARLMVTQLGFSKKLGQVRRPPGGHCGRACLLRLARTAMCHCLCQRMLQLLLSCVLTQSLTCRMARPARRSRGASLAATASWAAAWRSPQTSA